MKEPWLRAVIAITFVATVAFAVWFYAFRYRAVVHSDSAATALMADRALSAHLPVFNDWYYGNGEVWLLAPHITALLPVALGGVSPSTLLVSSMFVFGLELVVLRWAFHRYSGHRWISLLAASATLLVWSRLHVMFVYVETSYGIFTTFYAVLFSLPAALLRDDEKKEIAPVSRRLAVIGALLLIATTLQSPSRGLVFLLVPLLVVCAWPWRSIPLRRRALLAGGTVAAYALGHFGYRFAIAHYVTFSIPSGHNDFKVRDLAGIRENLRLAGEGLALLGGHQDGRSFFTAVTLVLVAGALALVVRYAFASREITTLRIACLGTLVQLGQVGTLFVIGNLAINPFSIRYVLPQIMLVLGLAPIVAFAEMKRSGLRRRIALTWLMLLPLAGLISITRVLGPLTLEIASGEWAHRAEHDKLATALETRGLRHGFATYWNANLLTLLSHHRTTACSVNFAGALLPYKWNTATACFDKKALPPRFYLATTSGEREAARKATTALPPPVETFAVEDFEVWVYDTAKAPLGWLDIPLPDGDQLKLPLRIPAAFEQLRRDRAKVEGERVVASGEDGTIIFGPYIDVPSGRYVVRWIGKGIETPGNIDFDVGASGLKENLAQRSVPASALPRGEGSELVRFEIDLPAGARGLEARAFSHGGGRVELEALVLEKP